MLFRTDTERPKVSQEAGQEVAVKANYLLATSPVNFYQSALSLLRCYEHSAYMRLAIKRT
jgi:hypothetical protein